MQNVNRSVCRGSGSAGRSRTTPQPDPGRRQRQQRKVRIRQSKVRSPSRRERERRSEDSKDREKEGVCGRDGQRNLVTTLPSAICVDLMFEWRLIGRETARADKTESIMSDQHRLV